MDRRRVEAATARADVDTTRASPGSETRDDVDGTVAPTTSPSAMSGISGIGASSAEGDRWLGRF